MNELLYIPCIHDISYLKLQGFNDKKMWLEQRCAIGSKLMPSSHNKMIGYITIKYTKSHAHLSKNIGRAQKLALELNYEY
jgi:hypothetical protein